jgi:hypothetical protein
MAWLPIPLPFLMLLAQRDRYWGSEGRTPDCVIVTVLRTVVQSGRHRNGHLGFSQGIECRVNSADVLLKMGPRVRRPPRGLAGPVGGARDAGEDVQAGAESYVLKTASAEELLAAQKLSDESPGQTRSRFILAFA